MPTDIAHMSGMVCFACGHPATEHHHSPSCRLCGCPRDPLCGICGQLTSKHESDADQ